MSKVDDLTKQIVGDMEASWAGSSPDYKECLAIVKKLIKAVREEEHNRIDALLKEYELHDHTCGHGGEPTWLVSRRGEELTGRHTLYSCPIDALLSKEKK